MGVLPWNINVEHVNIDYKKYLGPDWKKSEKQASAIVSNHSSWVDIIMNMFMHMPSHVSKHSVRNIPVIGKCAEMFGCLFMERENKDSHRDMFTQIKERQEQIDQGMYPPLIFYAEGGTSNGNQLLQFKKGAFFALKSV